MQGLIQRVTAAEVLVAGETTGKISTGLLLLLGIEKADTDAEVDKLLRKVLNYRVFNDDQGHMNLSLLDIGGELLVVSQFTLAANTHKGLRPSFSSAAEPTVANQLYQKFVEQAQQNCNVECGRFGADMQVTLTNNGPVTFLLST